MSGILNRVNLVVLLIEAEFFFSLCSRLLCFPMCDMVFLAMVRAVKRTVVMLIPDVSSSKQSEWKSGMV